MPKVVVPDSRAGSGGKCTSDMLIDATRTPAREIVFDTETTGIDPGSGHRLVEIGLVEMVGRVETGRVWHAYFNPERSMPPEAQAIHGDRKSTRLNSSH